MLASSAGDTLLCPMSLADFRDPWGLSVIPVGSLGRKIPPAVTDLRIYGFTPLPPPPAGWLADAHPGIKSSPDAHPFGTGDGRTRADGCLASTITPHLIPEAHDRAGPRTHPQFPHRTHPEKHPGAQPPQPRNRGSLRTERIRADKERETWREREGERKVRYRWLMLVGSTVAQTKS